MSKQKYYLDKIDGVKYYTDDFTLWNFYRSIFYGKPMCGCSDKKYTKKQIGEPIDWDVVTSNGKIIHRFKGGTK